MKITKGYLQQVIKEELQRVLKEVNPFEKLKTAAAEPKATETACPICDDQVLPGKLNMSKYAICPLKESFPHPVNTLNPGKIKVTDKERQGIYQLSSVLKEFLASGFESQSVMRWGEQIAGFIKNKHLYTREQWDSEFQRLANQPASTQSSSDSYRSDQENMNTYLYGAYN